MTNKHFDSLFAHPARQSESKLEQFHMDIAASIQEVTEDVVLKLARSIAKETSCKNLCLAGGVALNCVANGKIVAEKIFDKIWIQPAAGDAGGALGAALVGYYLYHQKPRNYSINSGNDQMKGAYLGPHFKQDTVEKSLQNSGAVFETLSNENMLEIVSSELAKGAAVGWMQGPMEFGPRALGARSILADPQSETMQKNLNLKVKFRESFRPFAPSILREDLEEWFDLDIESPYMLLVSGILNKHQRNLSEDEKKLFGIKKLNTKRSTLPTITHVDYSARIQTVSHDTNLAYYNLLKKFKAKTGCPVLVNTSFNVRGEPIVCTPEDAFRCFMGTNLDLLVIENSVLRKKEQDPKLTLNYKNEFTLD